MTSSVRRSATEIGLAFEKHCQSYLNNHLHMSLRLVGGANDGGIDLRGSWYLPKEAFRTNSPSSSNAESSNMNNVKEWRRSRIIAQCKAERKPLGPKVVRELEGVMAHLKSKYPIIESLKSSHFPFAFSLSFLLTAQSESGLDI